MRKLFKERKLIKGGNYMRKYGSQIYIGRKIRLYFRCMNESRILVKMDVAITFIVVKALFIFSKTQFITLSIIYPCK